MRQQRKALSRYVNAATDLAYTVKFCVQHNDNKLTDDAVLKLNEFSIAANAVNDMLTELQKKTNRYDN